LEDNTARPAKKTKVGSWLAALCCYLSESFIFEKIRQRNHCQGNKNSLFFPHSPNHHSSDTAGLFHDPVLRRGAASWDEESLGNVGQGNNSKETAFIPLTHVLSTVFLFRIPLPNIPLPMPAFLSSMFVLVAAVPRWVSAASR
jgi:hypothetical protein